jgi:hypothetical protein
MSNRGAKTLPVAGPKTTGVPPRVSRRVQLVVLASENVRTDLLPLRVHDASLALMHVAHMYMVKS